MASEVNRYKLGIFVILGLALAFVGVLVLGANRFFLKMDRVVTYFDESVQGLNVGSGAKFRGVPVGRVAKIYLAPDTELVAVEIEILPEVFVDDSGKPAPPAARRKLVAEMVQGGLRARLGLAGITGLKYVEFDKLDPKAFPVRRLPFEPPYKRVPGAPSALRGLEINVTAAIARLAQVDFDGIGAKLGKALERVNQIMSSLNHEGISKQVDLILEETRQTMAQARQVAARVNEALGKIDIEGAVGDARQTLAELKKVVKHVSERTEPILKRLDAALASLDGTSRKTAALVGSIEKQIQAADVPATARSMRDAFDRSSVAVDKVAALRDDVRRTLRELDTSLRTLGRFFDYLERHPDALITGKRAAE